MIKIGGPAPNFRARGCDNKYHTLKEFRGKYLVLYFYPKDFTTECTIEGVEFTKYIDQIEKAGAKVVGISTDTIKSHDKFVGRYSLKILLLSDPGSMVVKAYSSYGSEGEYGTGTIRNTFIIGKKGELLKEYPRVKAKGHAKEVINYLRSLKK